MKLTRGRRLASVTVAGVLALTVPACGAWGTDSVTMNLGHVFPDGSTIDNAADAFAEAVAERTDGALTIEVFPGGQVGSDEEMATALNAGTQDAAVLSQGSSGFGHRVQLGNLPYLVNNEEQADQVFYGDGFVAEFDRETLSQNGIHALEFVENGFRGLSNNQRPVEMPEDLSGLKIRVPSSDLLISIFNNWGAEPTAIPFPELYTALEQGTVDGQENGVILFRDSNFQEVQRYYTDTRYTYATAVFCVSQSAWESLPEDQQQILQEEAENASLAQREANRANVQTALNELSTQIDVTTLNDDQLEAWRASVQPIYDDARETFGNDVIDGLLAAVEEARS